MNDGLEGDLDLAKIDPPREPALEAEFTDAVLDEDSVVRELLELLRR